MPIENHMKKIFYPDRDNLTQWYLVFLALFIILLGVKTHFPGILFYVPLIVLVSNLIFMGRLFGVEFNLDDRTITTLGVTSTIEKISIDNIEYTELDTPEDKNIILTDRASNKSVKIRKFLFTERTLNEIRLIIKTKTIL